jgi:hypothetical protein
VFELGAEHERHPASGIAISSCTKVLNSGDVRVSGTKNKTRLRGASARQVVSCSGRDVVSPAKRRAILQLDIDRVAVLEIAAARFGRCRRNACNCSWAPEECVHDPPEHVPACDVDVGPIRELRSHLRRDRPVR